MAKEPKTYSLAALGDRLAAEHVSHPAFQVDCVSMAAFGAPSGIAFAESPAALAEAEASQVGAIIVGEGVEATKPHIRVANPRAAFALVISLFRAPLPAEPGIHPHASVHPGAIVAATASIGAFVTLEDGVTVADGAAIHSGCFVGPRCAIGPDTLLYPHVTLVSDVTVGANCIFHSGVVIGADGFGYAWNGSEHAKVPHAGSVIIGDSVEIGANTTIDRAMAGATRIGTGTKLDNLVQIGHNSTIGRHVIICGGTMVGGSAVIEDGVVIGGHTSISDHAKVGRGVRLAGRSGVWGECMVPGEYYGVPATPLRESMRQQAAIKKLPDFMKRFREPRA